MKISCQALDSNIFVCDYERMKKITYQNQAKFDRIARATTYLIRWRAGETLAAIAASEGISRQRVHSLIASLK